MGAIILIAIAIGFFGLIAGGANGVQIARRGCLAVILLFCLAVWGVYEVLKTSSKSEATPSLSTPNISKSSEISPERSYMDGYNSENRSFEHNIDDEGISDQSEDRGLSADTVSASVGAGDGDVDNTKQATKNNNMRLFVPSDHQELGEAIDEAWKSGQSTRWTSSEFSGWAIPSRRADDRGCRNIYFTLDQRLDWQSLPEKICR